MFWHDLHGRKPLNNYYAYIPLCKKENGRIMSENHATLSITAALRQGVALSRHCDSHRKNQDKAIKQLSAWFEMSGVKYWHEVTVDHIRGYIESLEQRELSPCTIRAYTNPLRLAHRAARKEISAEYLKLRDLIPPRTMPEKRFLSAPQVKTALKWADRHCDRAGYLCLAMGAMAGLRITEAMRIVPEDYNADDQTLTIGRDDQGRKNEHSARVIPLLDGAAAVLEEYFNAPSTPRHKKGEPYKCPTAMSQSVRRILDEAYDRTGDASFKMVKPTEAGRKSFMNACEESDVPMHYIRAYCGHAPERWDTLSRHYLALVPRPNQLPHVKDKALAGLNTHVLEQLKTIF